MERIIQKLIKRLATWTPLAFLDRLARLLSWRRPFSFLDRFVRPAPSLSLFGWTETPVDMANQAGKTMGLLLTREMEKGVNFSKGFHKLIGDEDSDKPILIIKDNTEQHRGDTMKFNNPLWKGGPGKWK